ncbi:hypothetical protein P4N68_01585 [Corynebacterium felinum]|uniref:Transglycosylase SLT domain-containing protein n=1 Tax=Corynebacterium felinum TaxID=131318 RepID=A0ABU2B6W5_9CORY|nr:hypothetical protein [Corynebacterium felinum]MDF5819772.1 hypothetical protein [Corynebacterium felinum]MDR7354361.1 hypothetical protein [Corynebacterium felinum]WJY93733.1 hypothetical protein CFELI_00380 [Corynebacterium felinum]
MNTRYRTLALLCLCATLTGCADRLEPAIPQPHQRVDQLADWAHDRAKPYNIPERALKAYAYAAWKVKDDSQCTIGWPTLAAIGEIYSNHARAHNTEITEDGLTSIKLRGLDNMGPDKPIVPDTDGGASDGNPINDIAIGPMQIMPSRWEQFAESTEPNHTPNPYDIDDAALTTARILCSQGNLSTPEGWDRAIKLIAPSPDVVKKIHARAQELSR